MRIFLVSGSSFLKQLTNNDTDKKETVNLADGAVVTPSGNLFILVGVRETRAREITLLGNTSQSCLASLP